MTAFDRAWDILKMPFVSRGLTADRLYQGRRRGEEDTGYWTPHKDKAVAYALFGRRDDHIAEPWVDPNVHTPEVYEVEAPKENVPLPLDMEYVGMGDASGAVDRRRVAFHDEDGVISSFDPVRIPDEQMMAIVQRLIQQNESDDGDFMEGYEIPRSDFERIFGMKGALENWEGMYVEDDSRQGELFESLSTQYDDDPDGDIDWDSLATTIGSVVGGDLRPFIERLKQPE